MPTKSDDIGRVIRHSAKSQLAPMGFCQIGRSRTWYRDHGFWAAVVEFQASSYSKASYLNVSASWLWADKNFWAFDYGGRVANLFFEFQNEEQFGPFAEVLAARAADESRRLQVEFSSLPAIARKLTGEANQSIAIGNPSMWTLYHAAVVSALVDDEQDAQRFFDELLQVSANAEWQKKLREQSVNLISHLRSREHFIQQVQEIVDRTRSQLKLPQLDGALYLALTQNRV
ncbi:hypothetical protein [Mesorhizobium sp. IMUNJ 23232]|uniref:hypothetical protein n=1 Tax=Mesorhizobium sp. IMUNJ 23232 TaxID=3376064 RepID=UPI003792973E